MLILEFLKNIESIEKKSYPQSYHSEIITVDILMSTCHLSLYSHVDEKIYLFVSKLESCDISFKSSLLFNR